MAFPHKVSSVKLEHLGSDDSLMARTGDLHSVHPHSLEEGCHRHDIPWHQSPLIEAINEVFLVSVSPMIEIMPRRADAFSTCSNLSLPRCMAEPLPSRFCPYITKFRAVQVLWFDECRRVWIWIVHTCISWVIFLNQDKQCQASSTCPISHFLWL